MKFGKKIGKRALASFLTAALAVGGTMWSPLALSVKAAVNPAVSLGNPKVISEGQYKLGSASVSSDMNFNMVSVAVDKGSLAVQSDSKYQIIYDNLSTHQNAVLKMNTSSTASEIQKIIQEKITFTVPQGQQQSVKVTVDGNVTNIPSNMKVTSAVFGGGQHHYMYVEERISWSAAYNKAKEYSYAGLQGYLVTVTSAEEDKLLNNITSKGGWSGGSRRTAATYDQNAAPTGSTNQYFRWACGPEAGQEYYSYVNSSEKGSYNGAYNGFKASAEPNNYNPAKYEATAYDKGDYEWCMQVNAPVGSEPSSWNDLNDNPGKNDTISGYFVEFSSYAGHEADTSKQASDSVTVSYDDTKKYPAPNAVEDQAKDMLSGLEANTVYKINSTEYTTDANGQITILDSWYGTTISIIRKGNGSNIADGDAQSLPLSLTDKKTAAKNQVKTGFDNAAAQVNALKNLSDNERKTFTDAINTFKADADKAIDAAKNKAGIASAVKDVEQKIAAKAVEAQNADKTVLDAAAKALLNAKNDATKAIKDKNAEVQKAIEAAQYLSASEKAKYKAQADSVAAKAIADIEVKELIDEIQPVKENAIVELDKILTAANQQDSINKANSAVGINGNSKNGNVAVKTGDTTNVFAYAAVLLAAIFAMAAGIILRRRNVKR